MERNSRHILIALICGCAWLASSSTLRNENEDSTLERVFVAFLPCILVVIDFLGLRLVWFILFECNTTNITAWADNMESIHQCGTANIAAWPSLVDQVDTCLEPVQRKRGLVHQDPGSGFCQEAKTENTNSKGADTVGRVLLWGEYENNG